MKIKNIFLFLITILLLVFTACTTEVFTLEITSEEFQTIEVGQSVNLDFSYTGPSTDKAVWSSSSNIVIVDNNGVVEGVEAGEVTVTVSIGVYTDSVIIVVEEKIETDPYVNVDKIEFYENYSPAKSYMDSYYRTIHGLMSGSIEEQDQEPTISSYQPTVDGKLVRNSEGYFSNEGNTYSVVDCYGEIVLEIYKGGAYVTLEEVAAYVLAFNNIPANYSESKKTKPIESIWGEYLRVNHTNFTGDTSRYPYEPKLPNISGCGGDYMYFEMDLGTTGTDCDPKYPAKIYNDGKIIDRGAARIIYSRMDTNRNQIIEMNERYVFYTYNHYNDFQEYLNYYNGWGKMFGNVTGGGTISSKTNYNPTPYVEVILGKLK